MTFESGVVLVVIILLAWMISSHNIKKNRTRFDELDVNQDGIVDTSDLDAAKSDLKNTAKKINKLTKRVK